MTRVFGLSLNINNFGLTLNIIIDCTGINEHTVRYRPIHNTPPYLVPPIYTVFRDSIQSSQTTVIIIFEGLKKQFLQEYENNDYIL